MKKSLKVLLFVFVVFLVSTTLVACGTDSQNIQGTWRMTDREQVEALVGAYEDNMDVTIELFVSEDNYFEMTRLVTVKGLFGESEEENRIFSGKVEKGNLVVDGSEEGDNKISYKRSDLKLTLTDDSGELVFQKDVKEESK